MDLTESDKKTLKLFSYYVNSHGSQECYMNYFYRAGALEWNDGVFYDGLSFLIKDNIVKIPLPTKKESETIHEFLFKNPLGSLQICAPVKVFQEFKFNPSIRIGEDVELWLRIANKFEFIPIDTFNTIALEHDDRSVNLKRYNSESIRNAVIEATMNYYDKNHSNIFSN